jgi:hypothetical protein
MDKWVTIVLLIVLLIVQEIILLQERKAHRQERQDLYNRIMARDFTEYKADGTRRTVPNLIKRNIQKNKEKLLNDGE